MRLYRQIVVIFFTLFFTLIISSRVFADDITYNQVVFFGDSLSDEGNLFALDFHMLPVPPYYLGRFSDGDVWTDRIVNNFFKGMNVTAMNFALGGETAIYHAPHTGYYPFNMKMSVDLYLGSTEKDKAQRPYTLYFMWIGSNDYLNGVDDTSCNGDQKCIDALIDSTTTPVVQTISDTIERLIAEGGRSFAIMNVPDLSKTPWGLSASPNLHLEELATSHNSKLITAIAQLQSKYSGINIHLYDFDYLLNDLLQHPDVYNQKYHTNLTDITTPCWDGGYTAQQIQSPQDVILHQLRHQNSHVDTAITEKWASAIAASPVLMEAYQVSQFYAEGGQQCINPSEHLFWDHVHPTAPVHGIISDVMIDFVNQYYKHA